MTRKPVKIVACLGVGVILLACLFRFLMISSPRNVNISISSTLMNAINIAELSTAEFRYKGIADVYKDEERTKLRCRLCYNAIVKAGIDMKKVNFDVDTEAKKVTAILPDINLKVTIVDEQEIATLPSDANVGIDSMLKISREDAENEAKQSTELISVARENLKSTIEALLYPILKAQGYSLTWG